MQIIRNYQICDLVDLTTSLYDAPYFDGGFMLIFG